MRAKGISYDTGFFHRGPSTHEPFDSDTVRREMQIIRQDLHCTAVRVLGGDPARLEVAAAHAADAGLEVWFSPFTCDLTTDEMLALLADCADRAERLRQRGAEVVLVLGGETSLLNKGFLPGDTLEQRMELLSQPGRLRELFPQIPPLVNAFLADAVARVRARFGGKLTYAAMPFERVDWTPFDFVSLDLYRTAEVAGQYRDGLRALVAQGKPVAITEFGSATYRGASDRGARGGMIVEWDKEVGTPLRLDAHYVRDEAEQAAHLRELLALFDAEGVDSAFVYTFANFHLPHRREPRADLDLASYGVVKVLEERTGSTYPRMAWEPKAAFAAVAGHYGGDRAPSSP
jgi:hypothetical protein